jgi:hypothetical protein
MMISPVVKTYGLMKKAGSVTRAQPDVFHYHAGVVEVVGDHVFFVICDLGSEQLAHLSALHSVTTRLGWHYEDSEAVEEARGCAEVRQNVPMTGDFSVSVELLSVRQDVSCQLLFLDAVGAAILRMPLIVVRPSRSVSSLLYLYNPMTSPVRIPLFGGIVTHRTNHSCVVLYSKPKDAYIACVRMTIALEKEKRLLPYSSGDSFLYQRPQLIMHESAHLITAGVSIPSSVLCSPPMSEFNDVTLEDVLELEELFTAK